MRRREVFTGSFLVFLALASILCAAAVPTVDAAMVVHLRSKAKLVRTVLWADGTSTTVQIDTDNVLRLDGSPYRSVGFNYNWGIWTADPTPTFRTELDYMSTHWGVRIVKLLIPSNPAWDISLTDVGNALDACYAAKMLVHVTLDPGDDPNSSIVPGTYVQNYINSVLNLIYSKPQWAQLIIGIVAANEMDYFDLWALPSYTLAQLNTFATWEKALIKSVLATKTADNIPVSFTVAYHMLSGSDASYQSQYVPYAKALIQLSDIPNFDLYFLNLDDLKQIIQAWESYYVPGQHYWITEFSGLPEAGGMTAVTSDTLTQVIFSCNAVSTSLFVMNADSSQAEYIWAWFTKAGQPRRELPSVSAP